MKNGVIYPAVEWIIERLKFLSLVELFKTASRKIARVKGARKAEVAFSRIAVDIFILAKYMFVISLVLGGVEGRLWTIAVWYLLGTNIYTYFYYHLWQKEAIVNFRSSVDRVKRRFMNLMLAIGYSVLCFAYLYCFPYSSHFKWEAGAPRFGDSLLFSIRNSLVAGYDNVQPISGIAHCLSTVQLLMMFFFLTVIISNSIPQTNQDD